MKHFKKLLSELQIPESKKQFLPGGYQQIGDIAILNLKKEVESYSSEIAEFILDRFPRFRTVCLKEEIIKGELRIPAVKVIAGEDRTETIHKENGCLYRIDVAKVMFSQGNKFERMRLTSLVKPGETVIDMFAGIGYFSIPIARFSKPAKIIAIDKNPDSYRFLKENVRLNCVQHVIEPLLGDSKNIEFRERADRIIMGYLPNTGDFLPSAFKLLKFHGIIHYHDTFLHTDLWKKPIKILDKEAENAGFRMKEISYKHVVKHYGPKIDHVVLDAVFEKTMT